MQLAERLYVPRRRGVVDAIDATTGALLWRTETEAELTTSALVFDGELSVGTADGRLLRLDLDDGTLAGVFDPGGPGGYLHGYLTATDRCVVAIQGMGTPRGSEEPEGPHSIACLRPKDGEVVWQRPSEKPWTSLRPLVRGGTAVVGTDGRLAGLDAADGSPLWERSVDGTPRGLGASPEHLYLGLRQERPCRGAKTARTTERPVLGALEPAVEDVDGASEVLTGGDGDRRSSERTGTCGTITG